MKKIQLFTFTFCILQFAFSQEYGWKDISANIPTYTDLSDVFFVSDDEGWITSSFHAEIYHTTDGGETFEIQSTQYPTIAIKMLDSVNGYSGYSRIYMTTDGGKNWIAIDYTPLLDLDFVTTSQGYASGDHGTVFSITPEGATNLNCQSNSTLSGISAPSVNNVWVCGGNRIYYYNGIDFTNQIAPSGTFNDIHFINNQLGWVVGDGGVIGHTTDGGANWITQTNPDTSNRSFYKVFFLNASNGWAVGFNGIILHTTNGGNTWTIEGVGLTSAFLRGVYFTSSTNGYVVGNGKTLMKYTQVSGIADHGLEELDFEIYPNPCQNEFIIKVRISDIGYQISDIITLAGNTVKSIKLQGQRNIIDVSDLPAGIYLIKLQTEDAVGVQKFIIQ
jgi:photosystem II stability/assembly factor-like uncharacterized protein